MRSFRCIVITVCIAIAAVSGLGYVDVVGLLGIDTGPTVREMRPGEQLDPPPAKH